MQKPIFVSLAGWVFLTLMTLATANGVMGFFSKPAPPPMSATWTGLCILAAFPCLMIWMFGTTMFHLSRKRLLQVQEQMQLRASKQAGDRLESFPPSLDRVAASARTERR